MYASQGQCQNGVQLLKGVAEKGWDLEFSIARDAYTKEDYESALLGFAREAEKGDMEAQINFSFIYDGLTEKQRLDIHIFENMQSLSTRYWMRSAAQVKHIYIEY